MFLKCLGSCNWKDTSLTQTQYPTAIEELCHQFSLTDIWKSTNNFDENRIIECGILGKVYKGCLQGNTVAIKRLHEGGLQGSQEFKNEIELLCQLHHPNLVPLIGFCNHEIEKVLVYQYMCKGSLEQHLLPSGHVVVEALPWKKRLRICIGAARGLHYLHTGLKRTIIHCNVQPRSILFDEHMEPKLTGLAFSQLGPRFMSKPKPIKADFIHGTWGYMAMEYVRYGTVADKCDVYAFGVVLLQVVCRRNKVTMLKLDDPLKPTEEIIDSEIKGSIAPECWEVYIDIIQRCIHLEPEERPTMGEVEVLLEHALSLQEQADERNTNCSYTLFSTTIINTGAEDSDLTEYMYHLGD